MKTDVCPTVTHSPMILKQKEKLDRLIDAQNRLHTINTVGTYSNNKEYKGIFCKNNS